tara:strand:- start:1299 stop:1589 length:291 start_codon:yes stop_codon:yes gene_type:complete
MKTNVNLMSIKTYYDLRDVLSQQELRVYDAVRRYPGRTRRELEELTKIRQSSISGRANELVAEGVLDDRHGEAPCSITNRPAGRLYLAVVVAEVAA